MSLRVAIAHEWLVNYAGSERVVEQMLEVFPDARLLTTVIDRGAVPEVFHRAEPSFLQRVPGAVTHHEYFLPLMPAAWRLREPLDDVDLVISSSHACAKAVRVAPGIPHLCYCHAPMRYAWNFELERDRFPRALQPAVKEAMRLFRGWDRRKAGSVTAFIANSAAVADRIERAYGREANVIHPPVDTAFYTPTDMPREDFFLFVGRLVAYKRPDLVVRAFADLPYRLIVAGEGPLRETLERGATPNVTFAGRVSDESLRDLYRRTAALVYPAEEDFGIVMAEAQACGAPVIALRRGGAPDIVRDGETGILIEQATLPLLSQAVDQIASSAPGAPNIARVTSPRFASSRFRDELLHLVKGLLRRAI